MPGRLGAGRAALRRRGWRRSILPPARASTTRPRKPGASPGRRNRRSPRGGSSGTRAFPRPLPWRAPDPAAAPAPQQAEPALSDADLMAQFAYADVPVAEPEPTAPAPTPVLPPSPPPSSEAGDSLHEGRLRRPGGARRGGQRSDRTNGARMGVSARGQAPVLRLACRVPRGSSELAEPRLDSRTGRSRSRRASGVAGDRSPLFSRARRRNRAPARSPRRARMRRWAAPEEASEIIRSLWRDGNFDALTESVILREFGASLSKADHAYRADRLIYAGYLSAGARAAALAGPDVLALAQARVAAARAPMSPALVKGGPAGAPQRSRPFVLADPVRPPRRPRLRSGGHAEPCAARPRRARQSGPMVERAQDGRPRAARPRRAATGF